MGVRVEERRLPSGLCGFYYEPARLIVLDESMPDFQRRGTLCHELVHARYHDNGCGSMASRPNVGHAGRPRCASSTRSSTRAPKRCARVTRTVSRASWTSRCRSSGIIRTCCTTRHARENGSVLQPAWVRSQLHVSTASRKFRHPQIRHTEPITATSRFCSKTCIVISYAPLTFTSAKDII